MVHAEVFLAEEGVFECMNVRDVDLLSRLELVEPVSSVGLGSKEIAEEVLVIRLGKGGDVMGSQVGR